MDDVSLEEVDALMVKVYEAEECRRIRNQNELAYSLGSFQKSPGCIWHRQFPLSLSFGLSEICSAGFYFLVGRIGVGCGSYMCLFVDLEVCSL
jgi:hypothetical protein